MPFYDEEVKRQLDAAERAGCTGRALVDRVAAGFDLHRMTPDQRLMLNVAFDKLVRPAAKRTGDGSKQAKMFG
jgi:hypothetical protein